MARFKLYSSTRHNEAIATVETSEIETSIHPVLIWFPGTDYRGDDTNKAEDARCPLHPLLADGYAIVHVHFRRSSGSIFPVSLETAIDVVTWIARNGLQKKLNKDEILLGGFGLSGSFAAWLPHQLKKANVLSNNPVSFRGIVIYMANMRLFALPSSPTSNTLFSTQWAMRHRHPARSLLSLVQPSTGLDGIKNSPENAVYDGYPPVLLLRGAASFREHPQSYMPFFNQLHAKGLSVELGIVQDAGHSPHAISGIDLVRSFFLYRSVPSKREPALFAQLRSKCDKTWERYGIYNLIKDDKALDGVLSFTRWQDPLKRQPVRPLIADTFKSSILGEVISAYVYLPPSYHRDEKRRYPTIYLLTPYLIPPRQTGSQDYLNLFDVAVRSGDLPEALYVLPQHRDRNYVSSSVANYYHIMAALGMRCKTDVMISKELVAFIDSKYRTMSESRYRSIMGECASAKLALQIGLNQRTVFGAVDLVSPGAYNWKIALPILRKIFSKPNDQVITVLQGSASQYGTNGGKRLRNCLRRSRLNHKYVEIKGGGHGIPSVIKFATTLDPLGQKERWSRSHPIESVLPERLPGSPPVEYDSFMLYKPSNGSSPTKVIVYIPSGNYLSDFWQAPMHNGDAIADLIRAGFTIAVLKHKPFSDRYSKDLLTDCALAMLRLNEKILSLGLDATHFGLFGVGGGAYLAALLASTSFRRICSAAATSNYVVFQTRIAALCLCSCPSNIGMLDYMNWRDSSLGCHEQAAPGSFCDRFLTQIVAKTSGERWDWDISRHLAFEGPIQLIHGTDDPIVSPRQSAALHAKLREQGKPVALSLVAGHAHGDHHPKVKAEACRFFCETLNQEPVSLQNFPTGLFTSKSGSFSCQSSCIDPFPMTSPLMKYRIAGLNANLPFSYYSYKSEGLDLEKDGLTIIYVLGGRVESGRDYLSFIEYYDEAVNAEDAPEALVIILNPFLLAPAGIEARGKAYSFLAMEKQIEESLGLSKRPIRILECFSDGIEIGLAVGAESPNSHAAISLVLSEANVKVIEDCILSPSEPLLHMNGLPKWRLISNIPKDGSPRPDAFQRLKRRLPSAVAESINVFGCDPVVHFLEAKENLFRFYFDATKIANDSNALAFSSMREQIERRHDLDGCPCLSPSD